MNPCFSDCWRDSYIGVDPGTTGCVALAGEGAVAVFDIPTRELKRSGKKVSVLDVPALNRLARALASTSPVAAVIEDVWGAAGDNPNSIGKLMFVSGALEAAFDAAGVRVVRVAPQTWRGAMGVAGTGISRDIPRHQRRAELKRRSLEKARQLFPENVDLFKRTKDERRAEPALIAAFGRVRGL